MKFGNAEYKEVLTVKRCFFIGHRDAPQRIMTQLIEIVERLIEEEGVKEFVVGRYGNFDHMAARAVMQAKALDEDVRLVLMTPYHPAEHPLMIPNGFDEILYPFETSVPPRAAIVRANERVIRMSSYLVAYVCRPGKSRDFLEYAQRQKIKIMRIEEGI